jgi:hypothetical protein
VAAVVYSTIIYWSAGLNPLPERYGLFLVTVLLTTFCSMGLGFLVSAASPSKLVANAIGPPILIILLLFGKRFPCDVVLCNRYYFCYNGTKIQ